MNVKIITVLLISATLAACSTTTQIQYLEPAEVLHAAHVKRVAVNGFEDDSVGLSGKIETKLNQVTFNNRPYFTVVARNGIEALLDEQKLQYSGLAQEQEKVELGELVGAQAFVMGQVTSKGYQDQPFWRERSECIDKKCKERRYYQVRCKQRTVSLGANVKMVDVESSKVLYSGSLERTGSWESCADRADALPVLSKTWESFADSMAGEFVGKISPKYVYKKIQFLEDPDIPFSDSQKSSLKNGIEFVESGQLDKAEALFSQLVFDTGSQSYTASYNLGVVKEAQGEYLEAKRLYQLSGQLQKVPVEAISQALIRIDQVILKHQQAMKQIEQ